MLSLDDSLAELVDRGVIAFETAHPYFDDIEKLAQLQKRHYRAAPIGEPLAKARLS